MADTSKLLQCCLYFTTNSLARVVTRMSEEAFGRVGLSPSHAFLLMLVVEQPGVSQQELAAHLHLAPSTVSRFVDGLVARGWVEKGRQGKTTFVTATDAGRALREPIEDAWKSLYDRYSATLGREAGDDLASRIHAACEKLEDR